MRNGSLLRSCLLVVIATLLLYPSVLFAQGCERKGVITSDTDVYEKLPRFVTGRGWQGNRMAYLRKNTQVYICGEQSVEFGFSTKVWFQVAYMEHNNWKYGWILEDNIRNWRGMLRDIELCGNCSTISVALAAESPISTPGQSDWKLGNSPPGPSLQGESNTVSSVNENSATLSDEVRLYAPLFVAMLLGMIAKGAIDWLDAADKAVLKLHLRNALVAVLVSPIVFLGFLSAGQFSTSTQTFIVLWLLAFQNGFFWQTVLKRNLRGA